MTKSFHEWVGSMAGTIEDKSEFIKPCHCGTPSPLSNKPYTPLQIRMYFANLLVPKTNTSELAREWIEAFSYHGQALVSLRNTIGEAKAAEYYSLEDFEEPVWLMSLRRDIEKGITSWDE